MIDFFSSVLLYRALKIVSTGNAHKLAKAFFDVTGLNCTRDLASPILWNYSMRVYTFHGQIKTVNRQFSLLLYQCQIFKKVRKNV